MKTSIKGKKKTAAKPGAKSVSTEADSELLEIPEVAAERPAAKAKAPLKRSAVSATKAAGLHDSGQFRHPGCISNDAQPEN